MTIDALFTPFSLKDLKLANRIVMAPMTRSHSPAASRRRKSRIITAAVRRPASA